MADRDLTNNQRKRGIKTLEQELGLVENITKADKARESQLKALSKLRGDSVSSIKQEAIQVSKVNELQKQIVSNATEHQTIRNKIINGKRLDVQLSSVILKSSKEIVDATIKRKMINEQSYQTALLSSDIATGIVDAEEEILTILRNKKKLEDPAFQAKQKELDILKKKEEYSKTNNERVEKLKTIWQDAHALATDPKLALTAFGGVMMGNAFKFADTMGDIGTDMGLSGDQAMQMSMNLGVASIKSFALGVSAKKIGEAYSGITENMGPMTEGMAGMADNAALMSKKLKMSAKDAGKLYSMVHLIDGGSEATADSTLKTIENLARGAKVPIGKVMADVANSADLAAQFGYDNVDALGKAAVEAAKMGTTMDSIAKTAQGLMDVDNARNQAMQLSVLIGRQIDVSKAQQMIYNNDIVGAQKEMIGQMGGMAGWAKMDYFAREKAAQLLGTTTGELQKQIYLSEGLTETGEKQASGAAKYLQIVKDGAKFAGDNVKTLASSLSVLASIKKMKIGTWIKEKAHALYMKAFGGGTTKVAEAAAGPLTKAGKPDMRFKANKGLKSLKPKITKAPKIPQKGPDVSKAMGDSDKMAKGGKKGIGAKMKDLAEGLREMGKGTFKGIAAMALAGPAFIIALPSIPMLMFLGKASLSNTADNLKGLAEGLKEMGQGTFKGIAAMALAGPAMLLSVASIPFLMFMGLVPLSMLGSNFKGLSKGLQHMNKALVGSLVLGVSAVALAMGILAIPFLAFMSIPGIGMMMQMSFQGLASGLAAFGNPATAVFILIGIGLLALLGIALIPLTFAMSLLTPLVQAFGEIIIGVLSAVPPIIAAVATGVQQLMEVITLKGILLLGLLGVAMGAFGIGMLLAAPGLAVLSYIGAPALNTLVDSLERLGASGFSNDQLVSLAVGFGAMGVAGVAMWFGAPGFFAMSLALVAFAGALFLIKPMLPVIEKLAQLGIIGNMGSIGGGGGGKKEDKGGDGENEVVAKLDEMIAILKQGGKVIIDGKVAGKVMNLAAGPVGS